MRNLFFLTACFCLFTAASAAQTLKTRLPAAVAALEKDPQMKHGLLAFTVMDPVSGEIVFDHHGAIGLAPASTQKLITAAAAFELLGRDFRYATIFGYTDTIVGGSLLGALTVQGSGDPSLGSPRYASTRPSAIGQALQRAMSAKGITRIEGGILALQGSQESQTIPRGWIWEDIGNYYGAGHGTLNWQENQFDLYLRPGARKGEPVAITRVDPPAALSPASISNELVSGAEGSGDNAYLFFRPGQAGMTVQGSVPCCVAQFRISGAVSNPDQFTLRALSSLLGIDTPAPASATLPKSTAADSGSAPAPATPGQSASSGYRQATGADARPHHLYTHLSPRLDSLVYFFLQKSINLYGEALVHTIAQKASGQASYEEGLTQIRRFWKARGIDTSAIDIIDGSGLSPQNHVTSQALTQVLAYAYHRPWYPAFYAALPVYHGIRMKSGTIGGVKAYSGYINREGKTYAFTVIVNHFAGSSAQINQKLYTLLDALK